jgi:hypothetical protein
MKRIAIENCALSVHDLIRIAETEPVVLTRGGTPILGIVSVDEAEVETWSLGSNPDFLAMMERFRDRGRREGGVPIAGVRRRLGIPQRTSGKRDELAEEAEG